MTTHCFDTLKFPSGRPLSSARKDAKKLSRLQNIPLVQAQNIIAQQNGMDLPWDKAITKLKAGEKIATFNMNPYRKLLVLGLNKIVSDGLLSLDWDGSALESGHLHCKIAGEQSVVLWQDAKFGEVSLSVWWKYDHSNHPQANNVGNAKERFQLRQPLAKPQHYKKFVGVVCSPWLERDTGKYLQGYGNNHLFRTYTRRGEKNYLDKIPDPTPLGYEAEGRFHM